MAESFVRDRTGEVWRYTSGGTLFVVLGQPKEGFLNGTLDHPALDLDNGVMYMAFEGKPWEELPLIHKRFV
jgi:hypothetical protein